jgi:hypothetical protein
VVAIREPAGSDCDLAAGGVPPADSVVANGATTAAADDDKDGDGDGDLIEEIDEEQQEPVLEAQQETDRRRRGGGFSIYLSLWLYFPNSSASFFYPSWFGLGRAVGLVWRVGRGRTQQAFFDSPCLVSWI